jgi:two-component system nitrogen regulation response regulator NtrX
MARILVVDDEENIRKTLSEILSDESHEVLLAEDGAAGLRVFTEERPDAVLLDIKMPKKDGLELLRDIKATGIDSEVIMISGHGTIEAAVTAIKLGAYYFIQKPLSLMEVKQHVRHAVSAKRQRDEIARLRESGAEKYRIIGKSPVIEKIKAEVLKVAPTSGRVLISGESGTGKELFAFAVHRCSQRKDGPFVKINCAAIPQNLIESELFGHEKGAFTGAVARKQGKFEAAHGGTLFLDEIGDMDLNTQTKVLRVIQEGEFERVGGVKTVRVDVRIVAATHRDLEAMIAEGAFREDLYYRLNVVPVRVPTLAERVEDIPLLASHFLDGYCRENGTPPRRFSADAMEFLTRQKYKGNIRELRNVVERAAIMCGESEISADFLRTLTGGREDRAADVFVRPRPLSEAKDELERMFVRTQLELNGWDIPRTAAILGIARPNLHRKMKQLGIEKG